MNPPPRAAKEHFILPSQLCIGLHVHLDIAWSEHPFSFSSFKIKTLDQVGTIQSLGLERIRYSPEKSDARPLAASAPTLTAAAPAMPAAAAAEAPDAAIDLNEARRTKRERWERVAAHHLKVEACERQLLGNARSVKSISQNVFARPKEAGEEAARLVDTLADSMLVEADLAVHLMTEKVGYEDLLFHALNVTVLSMMLAREMKAPANAVRLIGLGALLHDVGKAELPERIVRKQTPLTRAEAELLSQHCPNGVAIAQQMGLAPEAQLIIGQHHEYVDGSGGPKGLNGTQMSLLAKIVALVNVFDNLCNPANSSLALTPHEALSTMFGQRRAQFDSTAMTTFVRAMGVYPPGTLVVLTNGTIGLVVSVNGSRPLKPTVLVYDPAIPKEEAMVVDLEHEPDVTVARALLPKQLPRAAHDYLSPRRRLNYYFRTDTGPE